MVKKSFTSILNKFIKFSVLLYGLFGAVENGYFLYIDDISFKFREVYLKFFWRSILDSVLFSNIALLPVPIGN